MCRVPLAQWTTTSQVCLARFVLSTPLQQAKIRRETVRFLVCGGHCSDAISSAMLSTGGGGSHSLVRCALLQSGGPVSVILTGVHQCHYLKLLALYLTVGDLLPRYTKLSSRRVSWSGDTPAWSLCSQAESVSGVRCQSSERPQRGGGGHRQDLLMSMFRQGTWISVQHLVWHSGP